MKQWVHDDFISPRVNNFLSHQFVIDFKVVLVDNVRVKAEMLVIFQALLLLTSMVEVAWHSLAHSRFPSYSAIV